MAERYKEGKGAMYSIWGGVGTFRTMTFIGLFIYPLVCVVRPALPIAYSVTLLVQAFACAYISMLALGTNRNAIAVAILSGTMLTTRGSAWGLGSGIAMYLLVEKARAAVKSARVSAAD
ncbi:MAG: hypothetical protein ACM3X4_11970 [Ignavibacteriales bacterium]